MPINGFFGSGGSIALLIIGFLLCAAAGYFIGSLNFGIIISKYKYKDDVRKHGSGNAGMTNMLRTYGKTAALITLLGDVGKAVLCALLGQLLLGESGAYCAGLFCILGHVFPLYYHFKGGKGVLTLAVLVLVLNPLVFLVLFTLFVLIVSLTKYISLGSVICAFLYPLILSKFVEPNIFILLPSIIIALLVIWMHRANIKRLMEGTESKLSLKSKKSGRKMPKWAIVCVNIALIALLTGAFFLMTYSKNGGFERNKKAAEFETQTITQIQMRWLYIDTVRGYLQNQYNANTFILKNYDAEKPLYMQKTDTGETYAEYFMRLTKQRAEEILLFNAAADKAGFQVSETALSTIDIELTDLENDIINSRSTFNQYLLQTYGAGMKRADIVSIRTLEARMEEYILQIGDEEAQKILNRVNDEGNTIRFREGVLREIMKKH